MKGLINILKDEKGGAIVIVFLIILPLLFVSIVYANEIQRLSAGSNINLKNTAVLSAKAAAQSVEEKSQAYGTPLIDPNKAHQNFEKILKRNLKLNDSLNPLPNSPLRGELNYYLLVCNGVNEHGLPQGVIYSYENGSLLQETITVGNLPASFGVNKRFEVVPGDKTVQLETPGVIVIIEAGIRPVAMNVSTTATRWASARIIY